MGNSILISPVYQFSGILGNETLSVFWLQMMAYMLQEFCLTIRYFPHIVVFTFSGKPENMSIPEIENK